MNEKVQMEQDKWDRIKKAQEEFFEAFKDYDPDDVREALNNHPASHGKWDGVPLMQIAGFYAAWKEGGIDHAVYAIEELKAILDAKKES